MQTLRWCNLATNPIAGTLTMKPRLNWSNSFLMLWFSSVRKILYKVSPFFSTNAFTPQCISLCHCVNVDVLRVPCATAWGKDALFAPIGRSCPTLDMLSSLLMNNHGHHMFKFTSLLPSTKNRPLLRLRIEVTELHFQPSKSLYIIYPAANANMTQWGWLIIASH